MSPDEISGLHQAYEGQGGGIECDCGWPTREDFSANGPDWYPDFTLHVLGFVNKETA